MWTLNNFVGLPKKLVIKTDLKYLCKFNQLNYWPIMIYKILLDVWEVNNKIRCSAFPYWPYKASSRDCKVNLHNNPQSH